MTAINLFPREKYSVSFFENRIYLLDGFDKNLSFYDTDLKMTSSVSLKNIAPSGFFDTFMAYDRFRSYLIDSENGAIYLLDESYALKKQFKPENPFEERFFTKVFPLDYNSLTIASYDKCKIYKLENSILTEKLDFGKEFTDIYAAGSDLYALFKNDIAIYSREGIFKKRICIADTLEYESIHVAGSNILVQSGNDIIVINQTENKINRLSLDEFLCYAASDSVLYYFSVDSLKLKAVKL